MEDMKLLTEEEQEDVTGGRIHLKPSEPMTLADGLAIAGKLATALATGDLVGALGNTLRGTIDGITFGKGPEEAKHK